MRALSKLLLAVAVTLGGFVFGQSTNKITLAQAIEVVKRLKPGITAADGEAGLRSVGLTNGATISLHGNHIHRYFFENDCCLYLEYTPTLDSATNRQLIIENARLQQAYIKSNGIFIGIPLTNAP